MGGLRGWGDLQSVKYCRNTVESYHGLFTVKGTGRQYGRNDVISSYDLRIGFRRRLRRVQGDNQSGCRGKVTASHRQTFPPIVRKGNFRPRR